MRRLRRFVVFGLLSAYLVLGNIAQADDAKDVEKYIKILKTSKKTAERVSAISDLMLLSRQNFEPIKPAVPDLVEVIKNEKNSQIRYTAALVIANTGGGAKPALPLAVAILNDPKEDVDVKTGAAKVIGACGIFGVKETRDVLPLLTKIEKAELAKDASQRNDQFLEIVSEAIRSINAGTKDK